MEIKLKIDGEWKTFQQDTVNFATMVKVSEWQDELSKQMKAYSLILGTEIDEELSEEDQKLVDEVMSNADKYEDMKRTTDLILAFFDGQFTFNEFATGCYFENIGEFYGIGRQIVDHVMNQQSDIEAEADKKK